MPSFVTLGGGSSKSLGFSRQPVATGPTGIKLTSSIQVVSTGLGDNGYTCMYYTSPNNGVFPLGSTQQFSFEFFAQQTAYQIMYSQGASGFGACGQGDTRVGEFGTGIDGNSGGTFGNCGIGCGYGNPSPGFNSTYPIPGYALNTWFHLLFTRQADGYTRIFGNGYMIGCNNTSINFQNTSSAGTGRTYWNSGYPWNGIVSNARSVVGSVPTGYQTASTTVSNTSRTFVPPIFTLTTTSQGCNSSNVTGLWACDPTNPYLDISGNGRNLGFYGSGGTTYTALTTGPFGV